MAPLRSHWLLVLIHSMIVGAPPAPPKQSKQVPGMPPHESRSSPPPRRGRSFIHFLHFSFGFMLSCARLILIEIWCLTIKTILCDDSIHVHHFLWFAEEELVVIRRVELLPLRCVRQSLSQLSRQFLMHLYKSKIWRLILVQLRDHGRLQRGGAGCGRFLVISTDAESVGVDQETDDILLILSASYSFCWITQRLEVIKLFHYIFVFKLWLAGLVCIQHWHQKRPICVLIENISSWFFASHWRQVRAMSRWKRITMIMICQFDSHGLIFVLIHCMSVGFTNVVK